MNFETYVISLDPQGKRFESFHKANPRLNYRVFKGIRGAEITREERLSRRIVTAQSLDKGAVTDGHVGCALSHHTLWREVVQRQVAMLILEDDAITHPLLGQVISRIDFDFDLIFFALNTDTLHCSVSSEGVFETSTFMVRYPQPDQIEKILKQTDPSRIIFRRLLSGFGMCCYLISPQGASKLAEKILPLRLDPIAVQGASNFFVPGTTIDCRLNDLLGTLKAFVARPFLAWTPNSDSATRPTSG